MRSSCHGPLPVRTVAVMAAAAAVLLTACAAPFNELQSARLAGPDRIEVTPAYSAVFFSYEDDTDRAQNQLGFQIATGVGARTDIRLQYERITLHDDPDREVANVLGFGPKFGLLPDHIAVYVPVGFAFGGRIETSETFQVHPTLLLTLPLLEFAEINGSAKALIPITDRARDDLVAFNIGVGLGPDLTRWVLRPEIGILFNPGEDGHYRHFSIGLTYYFDRP